jgi:diguanylate cyclase (GGDEF)-like protein
MSSEPAQDPLTGLLNRRFFDDHLPAEVARARRLGVPLTLCLFDLNALRRVNDRAGHAAGDAVLQAVARSFSALRAGDIAFRIGGDEFAAVLPGAGEADGERVAHRIAMVVANDPDCMGVTTSWGAVTLEEADPAGFLARADAALYAAKRALAVSR